MNNIITNKLYPYVHVGVCQRTRLANNKNNSNHTTSPLLSHRLSYA